MITYCIFSYIVVTFYVLYFIPEKNVEFNFGGLIIILFSPIFLPILIGSKLAKM